MRNFLEESEREKLKLSHRKEKNKRTCDRIKAILMSDSGWSYRDIAKALLLNEETISRHVNEYVENKKTTNEAGGSNSKLSLIQTEEVIEHLEKTTYLKVSDICLYIKNKYNVTYTVSGMTNWLKFVGFSYKKPKGMPAKADPVKQEEFIQKYEKLVEQTPSNEPILFLDGVHPTMATKITYGWIRTGKNKRIETTGSRTRINLLGSINLITMQVEVKSYQTINQDSVSDYFATLREVYPEPDYPKIHIIADRGSYNISKKTLETANKYSIVLHHLPPYSPNLNAIERLWKVMNEYSRNNKFFRTAKEFKETINGFFNETWPLIAESMRSRINDNFERLKPTI